MPFANLRVQASVSSLSRAIALQIEVLQQQVARDAPSQKIGDAEVSDGGSSNLAIISEIESQVSALAEKVLHTAVADWHYVF